RASTVNSPLSLPDALPISSGQDASTALLRFLAALAMASGNPLLMTLCGFLAGLQVRLAKERSGGVLDRKVTSRLSKDRRRVLQADRKSTRLNSSHQIISYA